MKIACTDLKGSCFLKHRPKPKTVVFKWFLFVNLPLMTKNGHFIVNGSPKIIMTQIVRSPGIYFQKTMKSNNQTVYYTDFIAQRGTWLRLEIDNKKKEIWAKLKKTPKIPILVFLRCFGLSIPILNHYLNLYSYSKQHSFLFQKTRDRVLTFSNKNQHFFELYQKLYPKSEENGTDFKKVAQTFLYKKFLNPRIYNLSKFGRQKLNQTLGLTIPLTHTTLTAKDILFACFYLMECQQGIQPTNDIDDLKNRKIRLAGELLQNQFAVGLFRFEKAVREKLLLNEKGTACSFFSLKPMDQKHHQKIRIQMKDVMKQTSINSLTKQQKKFPLKTASHSFLILDQEIKKPNIDLNHPYLHSMLNDATPKFEELLNSKMMQSALREFFGTNPLCQLLDQTNPLAEMTHKRRLSTLGFGGIQRETAGMAIRSIHPTHYGRICPIETPEGQNAGLVNSFTIYSQFNAHGFIETPFYKVFKGLILKNTILLMSSDQEKEFTLAPGDIKKTNLNFLSHSLIPCRKLKQFKRIKRNKINYIALSPIQMISIATSFIPFLEHDDGNRALMGSNMQRQAVPTLRPNLPIVGTGLESKIIADIHHGVQIEKGGFVSYVDGNIIQIYQSKPKEIRISSTTQSNQTKNFQQTNTRMLFKKRLNLNLSISFAYDFLSDAYDVQQKNQTVKKTNAFHSQICDFVCLLNLKKTHGQKKLKPLIHQRFECQQKDSFGWIENAKNSVLLPVYQRWNRPSVKNVNSLKLFTILNTTFENNLFAMFELLLFYSNHLCYSKQIKKYRSVPFLIKTYRHNYADKKPYLLFNYLKLAFGQRQSMGFDQRIFCFTYKQTRSFFFKAVLFKSCLLKQHDLHDSFLQDINPSKAWVKNPSLAWVEVHPRKKKEDCFILFISCAKKQMCF